MRALFGVIVLVLLLSAGASAFTPGPTIIRECPKCRVPIEQATMASGNTFGARFWSDGKMGAPMLPDYPWLVKCPKCKHLFWIDEAKKLGDTRKGWKGQGKVTPHKLELPTVSDFYGVVPKTKDKQKQRYIRNHLWHCANDLYRDKAHGGKVSFSAQAKANMNALSGLMNEKDPGDRVLKAEIARELGQFDKCVKLLNYKFDKRCADTAAAIKMLARGGYAPVVEFTGHRSYQRRTPTAGAEPTDVESRLFARSMMESCAYVANAMLTRYTVDPLLAGDREKLRAAVAAGAGKGNDSAVAVVLDEAVAEGSADAIGFLLDSGARINGRCGDAPMTPLMTACRCGNESVAKLLIDRGADVDAKGESIPPPLTLACRDRSIGLAKLLLDNGAKVDRKSAEDSPLMTLCIHTWDRPYALSKEDWANRTLEMIGLLIDRGANVNGVEPAVGDPEYEFRSTPLIEVCQTTFEDRYDPDPYTEAERAACKPIYLDMIRLLLDSKADVNRSDGFGETPLSHACEAGNLEAVRLLMDRGADVNKASKDGTNPLSIANGLPDKSIARLLIERGAKPKTGK